MWGLENAVVITAEQKTSGLEEEKSAVEEVECVYCKQTDRKTFFAWMRNGERYRSERFS